MADGSESKMSGYAERLAALEGKVMEHRKLLEGPTEPAPTVEEV